MLTFQKNGLMVENSDELDTPLSLSCAAENLRMAAFYFDKARDVLEHAALVVESSVAADLSRHIQSAGKYQALLAEDVAMSAVRDFLCYGKWTDGAETC